MPGRSSETLVGAVTVRQLVLNVEKFAPALPYSWCVWQCLETFLPITTWDGDVLSAARM